jgi:hypothetical protein
MVNVDGLALAVLRRADASLMEVMGAIGELDRSATHFRGLKVGIAANVTVDLLSTHLRRHGYLAGVRLQVVKGNYDDLLGDARDHKAAGVDLLLVLPFFDNLQPSWEVQLENLDEVARRAVLADSLVRIDLALDVAKGIGQIFLLGAHLCNPRVSIEGPQQKALDEFNAGLVQLAKRHQVVRVIELEGLVSNCGVRDALDPRFYFRA